jgi:hypothetical protein
MFLNKIGKSIDIRQFVERYFSKIESFYEWLWRRQSEIHAKEIEATNQLILRARALLGENSEA